MTWFCSPRCGHKCRHRCANRSLESAVVSPRKGLVAEVGARPRSASYRSSVVGRAGVADMLVRRRLVRGVSFPLHSLLPLLSFRFGGSSGYLVCENMNVCLAAAFVPDYWKGLRCSTVNVLSPLPLGSFGVCLRPRQCTGRSSCE